MANLNKARIAVILVVALLAGASVYWALLQVYVPVDVIVAARDIKPLEVLKESDLRVTQMAKRDIHPQACLDPSQVLGAYVAVPLTKGEPIFLNKVTRDVGQLSDVLSMKQQETFISLQAGKVNWPKILKDGDLVSVVAFYAPTETVPSRIEDVAVGKIAGAVKGTSVIADLQAASQGQVQQDSVLLAVTQEDARKIVKALNEASALYLLPRHPALGGYSLE